jgi:hypothetical protein
VTSWSTRIDLEELRALDRRSDHVLGSRNRPQQLRDLRRGSTECREVEAADLDGHVAAHARQHLRHPHVDRLGEAVDESGKVREHGPEPILERIFRVDLPLLARS